MGRNTRTFDGKNVLITGCSKGIGRQLAYQIGTSYRVENLVIVARTGELLDDLKLEISAKNPSVTVFVEQCDLSKLDSVKALADDIEGKIPSIDVLINNAGYFDFDLFDKETWDEINFELQVNIIAATYLTHRFVPPMVARRSGSVINIGSVNGLVVNPGSAAYNGTKFFIHGFSECLRMDLQNTGVTITEVHPGPVKTEGWDNSKDLIDKKSSFDGFLKKAPFAAMIPPEQCASDIISRYLKGHDRIFPGRVNRMNRVMIKLIPAPVMRSVGSKFGPKIRANQYPSQPFA